MLFQKFVPILKISSWIFFLLGRIYTVLGMPKFQKFTKYVATVMCTLEIRRVRSVQFGSGLSQLRLCV